LEGAAEREFTFAGCGEWAVGQCIGKFYDDFILVKLQQKVMNLMKQRL
jgi:hypothetical protein